MPQRPVNLLRLWHLEILQWPHHHPCPAFLEWVPVPTRGEEAGLEVEIARRNKDRNHEEFHPGSKSEESATVTGLPKRVWWRSPGRGSLIH